MLSKKATKIDEILLNNVKSTVKISSIFMAFLENTNFNTVESPNSNRWTFSDFPTVISRA